MTVSLTAPDGHAPTGRQAHPTVPARPTRPKVAVVVQRCGAAVLGGSESLAWQYANLLRQDYEVEILTSTAIDHVTWANRLPRGVDSRDGIRIRRFPVEIGRDVYFHELNGRLQHDFHEGRVRDLGTFADFDTRPWSTALQEELIKFQGPHCPALIDHLEVHGDRYERIVFCTYLYAHSYFGTEVVDPARSVLVPTLHDEPNAYMPVYRDMAERVGRLAWLTDAERRLSNRLWGPLDGEVTAMTVNTELHEPAEEPTPYVMYSGRIEPGKGCADLIDWFRRFKRENPSDLRLVLTGHAVMDLPEDVEIDYRGKVPLDTLYALMAGAKVFYLPSEYESFSVSTLEAMAQRTPVCVNDRCAVLRDHVNLSGGGMAYGDYDDFAEQLELLLGDASLNRRMGELGREHVLRHYQRSTVYRALQRVLRN